MAKLTNQQAACNLYYAVVEENITPPLGIYARNWGAAAFDNAQGLHKPLMMQCLVTGDSSGKIQQVLFTADLGWWKNSADESFLRQSLLTTFQLAESQLLFCLSHTHAGPSICSKDQDRPGGEYIVPYLAFLLERATAMLAKASQNMQAGNIVWAYGRCDLASKRDLQVNNEYLVGYNPAELADDTLAVGLLRSEAGIPKAVLVNYACHPTTFAHKNTLLSPDYIGAMREVIRAELQVPSMFLQGASGDLAPQEQYVSDPAIVDRHGRKLGYAVLAILAGLRPAGAALEFAEALPSGAPLAIWERQQGAISKFLYSGSFKVPVPYKKLPSLVEIEQEYAQATDRVLKDRIWRKLNTRQVIGEAHSAQLPLWIWQMGDAILVAQPNETYSDFQLALRASFPNKIILVINIANGYVGYLPPADLYNNDMYAVWQTPFAAGALEKLTIAAKELIVKHCNHETRIN